MTDIRFDVIARDKASSTFNRVGATADRTSHSMAKFAKVAGAAAIGLGVVTTAAAVFAYKVGSDYVGSLNKIQALTGANDKTMRAAAKTLEANAGLYAKMGQTTGDAAAGVVELTKSGLSLHDSLKAVNATMVLAKAGELSVADASTLVANSLNTFGLKAKDAGKIANQLANAANISSADVSDLAESFKYVSPVAATAGVSMGEVNAILAELSNSGIKASQAGTTLRTFLLNLQAPAKAGANALDDLGVQVFDAQGKMKPLPKLIGELGGKLNKLPASEKAADMKAIFGKVGIAGATTILKGGTEGLKKYEQGVNRAGAATKLAQAYSKGLAGTFAMIKSYTISTAQSLYRQYSPALNDAILKTIQMGKDAGPGLQRAFERMQPTLAKIGSFITTSLVPALQRFGQYMVTQVLPIVAKMELQIGKNLVPVLKQMAATFKKNEPQIKQVTQALAVAIPPVLKLTAKIIVLGSAITGKILPPLIRFGSHLTTLALALAGPFVTSVGKAASATMAVGRAFGTAGAAVGRFATAVANKIAEAIHYITTIPGKAKAAIGNLGNLLYSAGQQVVQGLINGIESMAGGLLSKARGLASSVSGAFKGALGIHSPSRVFHKHGENVMQGLIDGIDSKLIPLQAAMGRVSDLISKVGDKISNLKSIRAGFKNTFSADSLFSVDLSHTTTDAAGNDTTTPETITDLIKYQKEQADKARQLAADVKAVTKKGLSKALVRQLQSQGASGAAALHALATGSPAEIARLNALNKQTSRSLQSAGMRAGNYTRGGSVNADIRRAEKQDRVLERLEHTLREIEKTQKKDQTIVVEIDSEGIIRAVRRRNKRKGVKSAGM